MTALLKDLFGLSISEGSIDNLLEHGTKKALPMYHTIQQKIQQSEVVGSDEQVHHLEAEKDGFMPGKHLCLPSSLHHLTEDTAPLKNILPMAFLFQYM